MNIIEKVWVGPTSPNPKEFKFWHCTISNNAFATQDTRNLPWVTHWDTNAQAWITNYGERIADIIEYIDMNDPMVRHLLQRKGRVALGYVSATMPTAGKVFGYGEQPYYAKGTLSTRFDYWFCPVNSNPATYGRDDILYQVFSIKKPSDVDIIQEHFANDVIPT